MSLTHRPPPLSLLFEALDELAQPVDICALPPPACVADRHEEVEALVSALVEQCAQEGVTYPLARLEEVAQQVMSRVSHSEGVEETVVKAEPAVSSRWERWCSRLAGASATAMAVTTLACFATHDPRWGLATVGATLLTLVLVALQHAHPRGRTSVDENHPESPAKKPPFHPFPTVTLTTVSSSPITVWAQAYTTITVTPRRMSQYMSSGISQGAGPSNYLT